MVGEPKYDEDVVNLGYLRSVLGTLNTELGDVNELLFSKSQNFGTLPQPPYRRYDTYMGPDGIYICHTERLIGEYNSADWGKASTYENVGDAFDRGIITAGTLQAVNGGNYAAGMTGQGSGDSSVRLWAGSTYGNRASAPFRVTQGGAVTATNITITGGSVAGGLITSGINAGNITAGTISTSRLNSDVITTSNFSAQNINADRITSGTITGRSISGGSININNQFKVNTAGLVELTTSAGYFSMGKATTHPWLSGVNVYSGNGVRFRNGTSVGSIGSEVGWLDFVGSAMYLRSAGTININNGAGGIVGIKNITINGSTITGGNGASMYANSNCMFAPTSGNYAYINSTTAGNRIAVSSGGPSSRNVKKNITPLNTEEYENIYKDIQHLDTHSFQYKYRNIKDYNDDFGFIIDEIEALPTLSKYARNYDTEAYVKDDTFIPKREDDETQASLEILKYKEWDRDSYIKTLMLMIKATQIKIDKLEKEIEDLKGGK